MVAVSLNFNQANASDSLTMFITTALDCGYLTSFFLQTWVFVTNRLLSCQGTSPLESIRQTTISRPMSVRESPYRKPCQPPKEDPPLPMQVDPDGGPDEIDGEQ